MFLFDNSFTRIIELTDGWPDALCDIAVLKTMKGLGHDS